MKKKNKFFKKDQTYLELKIVRETETKYICKIAKQKYRNEKFFPSEKPYHIFISNVGIRISSQAHPDFGPTNHYKYCNNVSLIMLYVRGMSKSKDDQTFSIPYEIWGAVQLAILEYNLLMNRYSI